LRKTAVGTGECRGYCEQTVTVDSSQYVVSTSVVPLRHSLLSTTSRVCTRAGAPRAVAPCPARRRRWSPRHAAAGPRQPQTRARRSREAHPLLEGRSDRRSVARGDLGRGLRPLLRNLRGVDARADRLA
jgi:hypothetical protein